MPNEQADLGRHEAEKPVRRIKSVLSSRDIPGVQASETSQGQQGLNTNLSGDKKQPNAKKPSGRIRSGPRMGPQG